jgi:hypothetical protein
MPELTSAAVPVAAPVTARHRGGAPALATGIGAQGEGGSVTWDPSSRSTRLRQTLLAL